MAAALPGLPESQRGVGHFVAQCAASVGAVLRDDDRPRAVAGVVARTARTAVWLAAFADRTQAGADAASQAADAAHKGERAAQERLIRAALPLPAVLMAVTGPEGPERPDPVG